MALAGEFEKPDLVVFADTGDEPESVYENVERARDWCASAGVDFAIVSSGMRLSEWEKNGVHVPLRTVSTRPHEKTVYALMDANGMEVEQADDPDLLTDTAREGCRVEKRVVIEPPGTEGMLFRTCTSRFKTEPIQALMRSRGWKEEGIELWLGMTTDEIRRVKPSRLGWITHRWPLIERDMRRSDCEAFLRRTLRAMPVMKSACVFCPFRSPESWRTLKGNDLARAVAYDESIRKARAADGYDSYVHRALMPVAEALDDGTISLFALDDGCEDGVCEVWGSE